MLKQLSVFVENKVGTLARVTTVFRENNINIRAIAAFDSPDFGILRVIVDKPEEAQKILSEKSFAVKITEVIAVELEDKPGDLDRVLNIVSKNGLSLNYIYSFVIRGKEAPLMVMNIENMEEAVRVLKKNQVKVSERLEE